MSDAFIDLIKTHLSAEAMAEIAADEWRNMCREYLDGDKSVGIANIAYSSVKIAVTEALGDDADKLIAAKAVEVINDLSAYTVFSAPSVYDRNPSPAWRVLQDAVKANSALVEARIAHHCHNLSKADALDVIKSSKLTIQTGGKP